MDEKNSCNNTGGCRKSNICLGCQIFEGVGWIMLEIFHISFHIFLQNRVNFKIEPKSGSKEKSCTSKYTNLVRIGQSFGRVGRTAMVARGVTSQTAARGQDSKAAATKEHMSRHAGTHDRTFEEGSRFGCKREILFSVFNWLQREPTDKLTLIDGEKVSSLQSLPPLISLCKHCSKELIADHL